MNILMVGDVFSKSGREALKQYLPKIVKEYQIDFKVVNGENITHGKGINQNHYNFLKELGFDVITSGNHVFKHKEIFKYIDNVTDLLRPANMNKYIPGIGSKLFECKGFKIRVTNMMGKVFMDHVNNPYEVMDKILEEDNSDIHLVDFHGEASAEKIAFAWNYDGKLTAVAGTHTHVQTADQRILPNGTAFITDLGMTGPINSIIGANPEQVIYKEKTGLPTKFDPTEGKGQFCGLVIKIDVNSKKVNELIRIFEK